MMTKEKNTVWRAALKAVGQAVSAATLLFAALAYSSNLLLPGLASHVSPPWLFGVMTLGLALAVIPAEGK